MSGTINYNVLLDVAKSRGLTEFDDLIEFTDLIENELSKKRQNESKKK